MTDTQWQALHTALHNQDAAAIARALEALFQRRQLLTLGTQHASLLLATLQCCCAAPDPHHGACQQALQHGLPLLARWAMKLRGVHAQQQQQQQQEGITVLQSATAWLLALLRRDSACACACSPATVSAALLFLGTAYPGCTHDLRWEAVIAMRALLSAPPVPLSKQHLWPLGAWEDACAGVRLMLEHLLQEDSSSCTWLLACTLSTIQHAAETAGNSHPAAHHATPSYASISATAPTSTLSSPHLPANPHLGPVYDGGALCPPAPYPVSPPSNPCSCTPSSEPSLTQTCTNHTIVRMAALLGAAMRQLGVGAVQALASASHHPSMSSSQQSGGGVAGPTASPWVSPSLDPGVNHSRVNPGVVNPSTFGGSPGVKAWAQGPALGAGRGGAVASSPSSSSAAAAAAAAAAALPGNVAARSACTVRSLKAMAELLACGSGGGNAGRLAGVGLTGPAAPATVAACLLASSGLLEGLQSQISKLFALTRVRARTQLHHTTQHLMHTLRRAFTANPAVAHLHPSANTLPHANPHFNPTTQGPLPSFMLSSYTATHVHACPANTCPPPPQGSQLVVWATGLIAGRVLASPALLDAVLPLPQTPTAVMTTQHPTHNNHLLPQQQQQHQQQHQQHQHVGMGHSAPSTALPPVPSLPSHTIEPPPSAPSSTQQAVHQASQLESLLARALLPSFAARTLLGCCLGLDALAACVLDARPVEEANAWLKALVADDPLFQETSGLARVIVAAATHPPLPHELHAQAPNHPAQPSAPQHSQQTAPKPAHDSAAAAAVDACSAVGREALFAALEQGAARAAARYATVASHAPACWLEALDKTALQDLMDRIFVSSVAPLPALLGAWPEQAPAASFGHSCSLPTMDAMSYPDQNPPVHHHPDLSPHHNRWPPQHHQQCPQQQQQQRQQWHQQPACCTRGEASARMLLLLGHLQFCRVQLPVLPDLVKRLVWEVLQEGGGCDALLCGLPSLPELMRPLDGSTPLSSNSMNSFNSSGGSSSTVDNGVSGVQEARAVWEVDAVMAARMLFLLPIAAACVGRASSIPEAAQHLLPSTLLLIRHPQPPLCEASHTAFASVVQQLSECMAAPQKARERQQQQQHSSNLAATLWHSITHGLRGTSASSSTGVSTQDVNASPAAAALCARMLEQALPAYVQRSLLPPWSAAHISGFERCLPHALAILPPASPVALFCLMHIVETASSWLRAHPDHTLDFSPLYGGKQGMASYTQPQQQQQQQPQQPAQMHPGTQLVSMACNLVLLADWQLLPQVLDAVTQLVHSASPTPSAPSASHPHPAAQPSAAAAPAPAPVGTHAALPSSSQRASLLQYLHDQLLRSDDYVRKGLLFKWLFELIGEQSQGKRSVKGAQSRFGRGTRGGGGFGRLQVEIL